MSLQPDPVTKAHEHRFNANRDFRSKSVAERQAEQEERDLQELIDDTLQYEESLPETARRTRPGKRTSKD